VTADDYEFLVGEASNDVRVRRCLGPRLQDLDAAGTPPLAWRAGDPWTFGGIVRAPGAVTVVIVPDQGVTVPRPEPTPDLVREVRAHLETRRDLTAHLEVVGPRYLPVIVSVDVVIWQRAIQAGADRARVKADTLDRIRAFLHPTRGGASGSGWDVGQPVFTSDLFAAIMPAADLGYISALQVKPDTPAYHFPPLNPAGTADNYKAPLERPPLPTAFAASVRVADYELVCAAADALHVVNTSVAQD
jgi:hypothetical protein